MSRPRKILLIGVAALAVMFGLCAVLVPLLVDVDRFRPQAEAKLQAALGRRVMLGHVRLSVWSGLALRTESVRVGEPLQGPTAGAPIVEAGATSVRVAFLPLLHRDVQVRSISIEGLDVTEDGKPLAKNIRLSSRLHIAPDGRVDSEGSVEGALAAMTAAPILHAAYSATLKGGALDIASLDATVGPMRVEARGKLTELFSPAPKLVLDGTAKLRRSQASGSFEVLVAAQQPKATFTLTSPLLDVDEMMAAVAQFAGNAAPARAAILELVPEAEAAEARPASAGPSFVRMLQAGGSLRADRCVAHGLEMTGLSVKVALDHGLAKLSDIAFAAYGGHAKGTLDARPFEPAIPFTLDQTADGIAIEPLIAALAPAQKGTVTGKASLAAQMQGHAGGSTLLPSMNGSGRLAIEDGKISSIGVIKQVMKALEVAGAKGITKDETPFDHLSAHFDLVQGTATTKDLEFRSQDLDGDGAGSVGLGGALKLDVLASFSKSVSDQLVAKTHALSIRQGQDGRLSVPLQVRGTITEPKIQLDLDRVIKEGVVKEIKKEGAKSLLKRLLSH